MKMISFVFLCTLLLASCTPAAPSADRQATIDAMVVRVALTSTAAAQDDSSGPVPETAGGATALPLEAGSSTTQPAEVDNEAVQATREAARPVLAELALLGVDAGKGRIAWIHPPLTLETEGFNSFKAGNDFPGVVAQDFVMAADITWDTRFGDSGCGFVLRSNGNQNSPSQYMVGMTRFANGHVGFLVMADGELVNGIDLYPRTKDRGFSAENGSTNRLAVVGQGNKFHIYTNGVFIGEVDPNQPPVLPSGGSELVDQPDLPQGNPTLAAAQDAQEEIEGQVQARFRERVNLFRESDKEFPKGFMSMVAITQSGKVSCQFNNAYLWLIEP